MVVCYGAAPVIDSKVEVVSHVHDMMGLLGVERIRTMTHRRWQIDDGFHDGSVHQRRRKVGNCRARGFFEDEMWSESTGAIARSFFWVLGRSGYAAEHRGSGGLGSAVMVWEGDLAWGKKNKMLRERGVRSVWCIMRCVAG
jgi:hypothetical protein